MNHRRRNQGVGLALLDVMACGLGAVLLLFLIIKHNTGTQAKEVEVNTSNYVAALENLQAQKNDYLSEIDLQAKMQEIHLDSKAQLQKDRISKQKEMKKLQQQIDQETKKNTSLEKQLAALDSKQTTDVVENVQRSEEQYLIGMKVVGKRIVILIDASASMTDDKLIDIIERKIESDAYKSNAHKQQGPKWQRTVRTAKWLLNRLPESSEVAVAAYSDTATVLNGGQWIKARDANGIQNLFAEINRIVPTGPTNLGAGFNAITRKLASATNVYMITDGLPTKASSKWLGVNHAGAMLKCLRQKKVVSGECRKRYFYAAVNRFLKSAQRTTVNVILLPLEGDPEAPGAYWHLAATTGGVMLSPAPSWP